MRIEPQGGRTQGLKATVLQTAPLPLTDYFPLYYCKHDGIRTAAADRPYLTVSETDPSSDWGTCSFNFAEAIGIEPIILCSITCFQDKLLVHSDYLLFAFCMEQEHQASPAILHAYCVDSIGLSHKIRDKTSLRTTWYRYQIISFYITSFYFTD